MVDFNTISDHVLDYLPFGAYFVDKERKIMFWNKEAEKITGFSREEVVGRHCYDDILCHIDNMATPLCRTSCPLHETLTDGKFRRVEVFLKQKDSRYLAVIAKCAAVYNSNGECIGAVETFTNNAKKIYSEDLVTSLTQLVMTDKLTGIHNRRYSENIIESKIQRSRFKGENYSVVFIDIDDFSDYNNKYGHDVGDKILKTIVRHVIDNLRGDDFFGRWGGEEFVGVFRLGGNNELAIVAEKIRAIVESACVYVDDQCVYTTVSIGATNIRDNDTVESVITRADDLMYESKKRGKNTVTVG